MKRRNYKGKNNPNYKQGLPKCIDCGKLLSNYKAKRCQSHAYIGKLNSMYNRIGENASGFRNGNYLTKHYCIECKVNEISYGNWMYGKKKCSFCANKGKNNPFYGKKHFKNSKWYKKMVGKNHFNWRGGMSKFPYAFEFTPELKEQIRKRDNYTCQKCNKTEIQELKQNKRKLTIHHIDYNKNNCKENNLITLCERCNSIVNFNRDYYFAYFTYLIKNGKI
jgi:hypothetical protein